MITELEPTTPDAIRAIIQSIEEDIAIVEDPEPTPLIAEYVWRKRQEITRWRIQIACLGQSPIRVVKSPVQAD